MASEAKKNESEPTRSTSELSEKIFPHILNMYNGEAKPVDFEVYSTAAVFEDPLMRAGGIPQIKSAFYSLPKLFKVSKMVEYTVDESSTTPGNGQIRIDNKQHYEVGSVKFDTISLILLEVKDYKVVRHEDRWDKKELNSWLGVVRSGNMAVTHVLMGFGKDPK